MRVLIMSIFDQWKIEFDLKWICDNAGKRVKIFSYHQCKYINCAAYPMNKAKEHCGCVIYILTMRKGKK